MAKLIWTDKAVTSLENIYDYIAADSSYYAQYQIKNILKSVERLKTFPESGRFIPEFPHLPHRELIVNPHAPWGATKHENNRCHGELVEPW